MWRDQNITHELLVLTEEKQEQVVMADQSILNIYFENRWLQLDYEFNKLIGLDFLNTSHILQVMINLGTRIVYRVFENCGGYIEI